MDDTTHPPQVATGSRAATLLRCSLVLIVLFIPNALRFPFAPLPGLNLLNIIFVVTLFFYYRAKREFGAETMKPPLRGYLFFFWFASFLALVSGMAMGHVPASFDDLVFFKNHLFYMGLYFLYYYGVRDRKTLDWVYWALIIVTAVAGLQAVRQAIDIGATQYSVGARVYGPFGFDWSASNTAGIFYAQFAPLIFAEFIYQPDRRLKLALLGAFVITTMGLFYTYSRKSYYALAAACALVGANVSKIVLLALVAIIMTFPIWAPETAVERLEGNELELAEQGVTMDESTESRFIIWEGAREMMKDYPLGVGLERFKFHIGQYSQYANMDAHNYYVLVAAEMGPLGEIAYLLMVIMMYREGHRLGKVARTPREKALAAGFKGTMIAFIMANSFGSAFNFGNIMGNLWALTALVSRARILIERETVPEEPEPLPLPP